MIACQLMQSLQQSDHSDVLHADARLPCHERSMSHLTPCRADGQYEPAGSVHTLHATCLRHTQGGMQAQVAAELAAMQF